MRCAGHTREGGETKRNHLIYLPYRGEIVQSQPLKGEFWPSVRRGGLLDAVSNDPRINIRKHRPSIDRPTKGSALGPFIPEAKGAGPVRGVFWFWDDGRCVERKIYAAIFQFFFKGGGLEKVGVYGLGLN